MAERSSQPAPRAGATPEKKAGFKPVAIPALKAALGLAERAVARPEAPARRPEELDRFGRLHSA